MQKQEVGGGGGGGGGSTKLARISFEMCRGGNDLSKGTLNTKYPFAVGCHDSHFQLLKYVYRYSDHQMMVQRPPHDGTGRKQQQDVVSAKLLHEEVTMKTGIHSAVLWNCCIFPNVPLVSGYSMNLGPWWITSLPVIFIHCFLVGGLYQVLYLWKYEKQAARDIAGRSSNLTPLGVGNLLTWTFAAI